MSALFRTTRSRSTPWTRRIALLALLVLEFTVALAPLMEAHHEAPESHIEQQGATHHYRVHDEATCPVCALRSIRALPSTTTADFPTTHTPIPSRARAYVSIITRDEVAHSTRAPPRAG